MKRMLLAVLLAASVSSYADTDIGVGLNARNYDTEVYIPIDLSNNFRLEPAISYYTSEAEYADQKNEYEMTEFSLGLFKKNAIREKMLTYYGGRVSYIKIENSYFYGSENILDKVSSDGFSIAPTLGIEYYLAPRVSLSGEVSLRYEDISSDSSQCCFERDEKGVNTDTDVVLRYFF